MQSAVVRPMSTAYCTQSALLAGHGCILSCPTSLLVSPPRVNAVTPPDLIALTPARRTNTLLRRGTVSNEETYELVALSICWLEMLAGLPNMFPSSCHLPAEARELRPLLVGQLSNGLDLFLRDRLRRAYAALPTLVPRLPFIGALLPPPPPPPIFLPGLGLMTADRALELLAPPLSRCVCRSCAKV